MRKNKMGPGTRMMLCLGLLFIGPIALEAQVKWDGEGGDGQWTTGANWFPDGVPNESDFVLLDQSILQSDYTVTLPSGATGIVLQALTIQPSPGKHIELTLPRENTASPGLSVTGPGESFQLHTGAVFRNASGALSGETIALAGQMRISNGARYRHQTARGNATLIDKLSVSSGTEEGIFEFDVPGTAGYTVSLTGNVFGSLEFSASAAGGNKSYSGSGSSILQVRGNLLIRNGVTLTSTLSANILLQGNLQVDGTLQLHPTTGGTTGRSIFFSGKQKKVSGSGSISMNAQFRNLEFFSGSSYQLQRDLVLPLASHQLMVHTDAKLQLGKYKILGEGSFVLDQQATLGIGDAEGITRTAAAGNIQCKSRSYAGGALYFFEGDGPQHSGDGLPPEINGLGLNKASGNLFLDQGLKINGSLHLLSGRIIPDPDASLRISTISITGDTNEYGQPNQGGQGSYVEGELTWESEGLDEMVLPVGNGGIFAPVKIRRTNEGPAAFQVAYHPSPHPQPTPISNPPLDHISRIEYWTIQSLQSGTEARLALTWRPSSGVGSAGTEISSLRIAQLENRGTGLKWEELGSQPAPAPYNGYGWIESNMPSNVFGACTLASATRLNALPLQRLRLSAKRTTNGVALEAMAEGTGVLRQMRLQKQHGNGPFEDIGHIETDPLFGKPYHWLDSTGWLAPGIYRAVAWTAGGSTHYSNMVAISDPKWRGIRLFPNPASEKITLVFPGLRSGTEAFIVHINGNRVRALTLTGENHEALIHDLPAGRYFLWIAHPDGKVVLPFIKF